MNYPHVVFPIFDSQCISEKYDRVFSYLNRRKATVHMVAVPTAAAVVHFESPQLRTQQQHILKMTKYLKYETFDRLAQKLQHRFASLQFEFHVSHEPLVKTVNNIKDQWGVNMVILDGIQLKKSYSNRKVLLDLISVVNSPLWLVNESLATRGEIIAALELPINNNKADRYNRVLVSTAATLAKDFHANLLLMHVWMRKQEEFLKKWLNLNDMDVARITRSEKQYKVDYLNEFARESGLVGDQIRCRVLSGDTEQDVVNQANNLSPYLVITGYSHSTTNTLGSTVVNMIHQSAADVLVVPNKLILNELFTAEQQRVLDGYERREAQ